jgi:cell division topological specificity factor
MAGFFDRMLGRGSNDKGSSSRAKDRLQFVLLHERINIPPEKMREMKAEILEVIAKYVPEIDRESVEVQVEQSDRYQNKLVAEIPFTKRATTSAQTAESDADETDDSNTDNTPDDETLPNLHEQETRKHVPVQDDDDSDSDDE